MPIDLVPQLVSAAIRAFGLGLVAFVGLLLFRVRSSAARHATWTVVLAGMLLQIPLGTVVPGVPLKALPTLPASIRSSEQLRVRRSARSFVSALQTAVPTSGGSKQTKREWVSSSGMLTGAYLALSMLLFVRMSLGYRGLRRTLRDAAPVPSLGSGIFESALFVTPGSVGWFRARIFLPHTWRDWDSQRLRAVLAHERAHIRRRDWLIRFVAHVNVCIFWFHPLAWWVSRELARLAEEACDDAALSEIPDREEYAATLVDLARVAAADGRVLHWRVISMAKDSHVVRRVNRILDRRFQVSKPFGRIAWVTLLACYLPVIYLSAAVRLAPANRDSIVLDHATTRDHLTEVRPQPLLPETKSSIKRVAQVAPNQPGRPAAPAILPPREDPPTAMCVLIDNSGSMRGKRAAVKAAALTLVEASRPGDEVCVVDFNDEVYYDLPHGKDFTSDISEMEEALTHIDSRGGSAMRQAVGMSIDQFDQAAHNVGKVLVLVTDGDDNASSITQEQLLNRVRNSGVRIYCIGLQGEDDPQRGRAARLALGQLAEASGGTAYYVSDLADVETISREIANEVRKQHSLAAK
jgi:hypothetical protein